MKNGYIINKLRDNITFEVDKSRGENNIISFNLYDRTIILS